MNHRWGLVKVLDTQRRWYVTVMNLSATRLSPEAVVLFEDTFQSNRCGVETKYLCKNQPSTENSNRTVAGLKLLFQGLEVYHCSDSNRTVAGLKL